MRILPPPLTVGRLTWIGVRPDRDTPMQTCSSAEAVAAYGLKDDRYRTTRNGKRQVTMIQAEHLPVIGALLPAHDGAIAPEHTRRNLVIAGINLLALKGHRIAIGETVVVEYSGLCAPCDKMNRDDRLGPGGFSAMRGHGGITARIIVGGTIHVGDAVRAYTTETDTTDVPPTHSSQQTTSAEKLRPMTHTQPPALTVYHYPKCSTCTKAKTWLETHGSGPITWVHLVEQTPSAETLKDLWGRSGLPLKRFFNTSGRSYRSGQFKERLPTMTDEDKLAALAGDGMLIKRPILDTGERVLVGFKAEAYADALGG